MVVIKGVAAKSILDSRKDKTILITVKTSIGNFSASSPNGKSTGKHAVKIYKKLGKDEEVIRVRKLKAEQGAVKVDQTVVQGDQITKTEIKDSVLNRSNVGSGGDDKFTKLKELTEMKEKGLISDEEYEKMKQEIIG